MGFDEIFGRERGGGYDRCGDCTQRPCACHALLHWPVVEANCHSDDWEYETIFNASSYFAAASDEKILELAREAWGHDYASDEIVYYFEERNPEIDKLLAHTRKTAGIGFECEVDPEQARAWVALKRPHLLQAVC
jgi:hypothetical protein